MRRSSARVSLGPDPRGEPAVVDQRTRASRRLTPSSPNSDDEQRCSVHSAFMHGRGSTHRDAARGRHRLLVLHPPGGGERPPCWSASTGSRALPAWRAGEPRRANDGRADRPRAQRARPRACPPGAAGCFQVCSTVGRIPGRWGPFTATFGGRAVGAAQPGGLVKTWAIDAAAAGFGCIREPLLRRRPQPTGLSPPFYLFPTAPARLRPEPGSARREMNSSGEQVGAGGTSSWPSLVKK